MAADLALAKSAGVSRYSVLLSSALGDKGRAISHKAVSGQLPDGRLYARDQRVVFSLAILSRMSGKTRGPLPSFGFGERQADVLPDKARDLRC